MVSVNDYGRVLNCMHAKKLREGPGGRGPQGEQSEFIHIKFEIGSIFREILLRLTFFLR